MTLGESTTAVFLRRCVLGALASGAAGAKGAPSLSATALLGARHSSRITVQINRRHGTRPLTRAAASIRCNLHHISTAAIVQLASALQGPWLYQCPNLVSTSSIIHHTVTVKFAES